MTTPITLSDHTQALVDHAAEIYKQLDHGYDATRRAQDMPINDFYRPLWVSGQQGAFAKARGEAIEALKKENPNASDIRVNMAKLDSFYVDAADSKIAESLVKNHKNPEGKDYAPSDYQPAQHVNNQIQR